MNNMGKLASSEYRFLFHLNSAQDDYTSVFSCAFLNLNLLDYND